MEKSEGGWDWCCDAIGSGGDCGKEQSICSLEGATTVWLIWGAGPGLPDLQFCFVLFFSGEERDLTFVPFFIF